MLSLIGGKGQGLEFLLENTNGEFIVPQFRVVDSSHYQEILKQIQFARVASILSRKNYTISSLPKSIKNVLNDLYSQFHPENTIVRSSSIKEDGELSFAGIYSSEIIEAGLYLFGGLVSFSSV